MPAPPSRSTGTGAEYHLHIGGHEDHAFIDYFGSEDGSIRVALSQPAERLIEAKMVLLRYIHNGWGPDGNLAKEKWQEWLATTDVRKAKVPRAVRLSVEQRIQEVVDSRSGRWASSGWWTNTKNEDGEYVFCGQCHRESPMTDDADVPLCFLEDMDRRAEEIVQNPDTELWVGEMGTLLCERHRPSVGLDLSEVDVYDRDALDEAMAQFLDRQLLWERVSDVTTDDDDQEDEQQVRGMDGVEDGS